MTKKQLRKYLRELVEIVDGIRKDPDAAQSSIAVSLALSRLELKLTPKKKRPPVDPQRVKLKRESEVIR